MFYFIAQMTVSMVIVIIVISSVFYIASHFANLNKKNLNKENHMTFDEWSSKSDKTPWQLLVEKNTSDLVESIALGGMDIKPKAGYILPSCAEGYDAVVCRHGRVFNIIAGISIWDGNPIVHIDDIDVSESVNGRFILDALFVMKTDTDNLLKLKAKEERALKAQEKFQEMRGVK